MYTFLLCAWLPVGAAVTTARLDSAHTRTINGDLAIGYNQGGAGMADVNLTMPAALAGAVNALQWLVEQGADQAAEDTEGMTPVQAASGAEEDTCVEFLVTGVVPVAEMGVAGAGDEDDFDDAAFNALMGM